MKIAAALLVFVCIGLGFLWFGKSQSQMSRRNILIGTSPVSIWSWNTNDSSITLVVLPSDIAIDSSRYGRYSLEALWKLGFIDNEVGLVLARSLTETLAIPLTWFIGEGATLKHTTDPRIYGKNLFSLRGLVPFLLGRRTTNISVWEYFRLMWALSRVTDERIDVIDFAHQPPTASETLPDGSERTFFDRERVDILLTGLFEDELIRKEEKTVAIYNTTGTQALGTYAARLLTGQGVFVVAVGNSEPEINQCVIEGSLPMIQSKTALVITELFNCKHQITQNQQRADIIVRLGTLYASQFVSAP